MGRTISGIGGAGNGSLKLNLRRGFHVLLYRISFFVFKFFPSFLISSMVQITTQSPRKCAGTNLMYSLKSSKNDIVRKWISPQQEGIFYGW